MQPSTVTPAAGDVAVANVSVALSGVSCDKTFDIFFFFHASF